MRKRNNKEKRFSVVGGTQWDAEDVMSSGRLLQIFGTATVNALLPTVTVADSREH